MPNKLLDFSSRLLVSKEGDVPGFKTDAGLPVYLPALALDAVTGIPKALIGPAGTPVIAWGTAAPSAENTPEGGLYFQLPA